MSRTSDTGTQKPVSQAADLPSSVLFVCNLNSIRSPIAEGLLKLRVGQDIYVQSAGVEASELESLMVAIMAEKGADMTAHISRSLSDLEDSNFDLVIAFTERAYEACKRYFEGSDTVIEKWLIADPALGALDVRAIMNDYRVIRDFIDEALARRFPLAKLAT